MSGEAPQGYLSWEKIPDDLKAEALTWTCFGRWWSEKEHADAQERTHKALLALQEIESVSAWVVTEPYNPAPTDTIFWHTIVMGLPEDIERAKALDVWEDAQERFLPVAFMYQLRARRVQKALEGEGPAS